MKLLFYCLLAMLWPVTTAFAQAAPASIKPLRIGDTLPATLEITNVLNYPVSKIRLSDLKTKLIILDFFATSCAGCIRDLPKLDSLQRLMNRDIQIITVTYEDRTRVEKFLSHNPLAKASILPFATNDSLFSALFPHASIPHEVWIDDRKIIRAITEPEMVTAENLAGMAFGTISRLPVKRDRMDFSRFTPMPDILGSVGKYYSLIAPAIDGIPGVNEGLVADTAGNSIRFFAYNMQLTDLYNRAFDKEEGFYYVPNNKLVHFDTALVENAQAKWCYEVVLPLNTPMPVLKKKIRMDLDSYFGLQSSMELTPIRCLVVSMTNQGQRSLQSHHAKREVRLAAFNDKRYIHNDNFLELLIALNREIPNIPVIDETKITGTVDIELGNTQLDNIPALNKILASYGLTILEANCVLPTLHIGTVPKFHYSNN